MRTLTPLVAVVSAFVLVASAAATAPQSGVMGTVKKSPITPVCREGVRCSAPAAGIVLTFTRSGMVVGRVISARDGTFRLPLPAGNYSVRWLRSPAIGVLRPRTVVVLAGRFTILRLVIDTGIRSVSGRGSPLP